MKKLIVIIALALSPLMAHHALAQAPYQHAIGLRAGMTQGLTYKNLNGSRGIEAIVGLWNYGWSATVLVEKYYPVSGANGLNVYLGAGGHIAAESRSYTYYRYYTNRRVEYYVVRGNGDWGIGIDGIAGLEYKVPGAPLAFSIDVKPFIEMSNAGYTWAALDPGIGIKVAF